MQSLCVVTAAWFGLVVATASVEREQEIKFSECPAAVRKGLEAEAKGAKIETVSREKDDGDETVYWADITIGGRAYEIGVLEDGTLTEMNLAIDDEDLAFDRAPAAVQATFRNEAFGEKVEMLGRDMKYGVPIYEAVVEHKGKKYELVVAEDGTLVEKVLVIDDEEVELAQCPAAVQAAFHQSAKGGKIGDITRTTGIGLLTYEAEVAIKGKIYLVEVSESGLLISKSLEAAEE
jgi:hypothetical protein